MSIKLPLIVAGLVIATGSNVFAAGLDGWVDARQNYLTERIEQGRRTGEITWTEGIKLRAEQRRIEAAERAFKADDGRIDKYEYRQLRAMQESTAQHIASEAHDARARPSWLPRIGK